MTTTDRILLVCALFPVVVGLPVLFGAALETLRARRRARIARRRLADAEVDIIAQAIANCYGHGPLAVMDPLYQAEFRRDARAAIAAMQSRPS